MTDRTMLKVWANADFSRIDLAKMEKGTPADRSRADAIQELIDARDALLAGGAGGKW